MQISHIQELEKVRGWIVYDTIGKIIEKLNINLSAKTIINIKRINI